MAFKGTSQGGGLNFWKNGITVELSSRPGEDPRQIAAHAAETINARQQLKEEGISAEAQGPELKIHVSEFWVFVCPSDKGLIVPPAPYDLRVEKASDGLVQLSWKNPPGGYDRIHILRGTLDVADGIDGTNTTFSEYANEDKLSYHVFRHQECHALLCSHNERELNLRRFIPCSHDNIHYASHGFFLVGLC